MHQILWSFVEEHCPHSRTLSRETYVLLSIGYKLQRNDGTFSKIPLGITMKKLVLWGRIQGRNNRSKEWESFSQAGNAAARYHLKATEKHISEPKTRGCDDEQTIKCGCCFSYICNFAVLVSDIINYIIFPSIYPERETWTRNKIPYRVPFALKNETFQHDSSNCLTVVNCSQ